MTTDAIVYICHDCGTKYGKERDTIGTTMHQGNCDHCSKDAGLCHVRNYGWPKFINEEEAEDE